jgi:hypothetical protein
MFKNSKVLKFDEFVRSYWLQAQLAPFIGCNFKHKQTSTNAFTTLIKHVVDQQIKHHNWDMWDNLATSMTNVDEYAFIYYLFIYCIIFSMV